MKIDQLMVCLKDQCREVSPVQTHCPVCMSQDLAELSGHYETISQNERDQRREDLFAEIQHIKERIEGAVIEPADEHLGVGA